MLPGDVDLNDVFQDIQLLVGSYREKRCNIAIMLDVEADGDMELNNYVNALVDFTGDAITCEGAR